MRSEFHIESGTKTRLATAEEIRKQFGAGRPDRANDVPMDKTYYIDTDDDTLFTTYSNGAVHFDANGQINLGNAHGSQMVSMVSTVPEPGSACLLGFGILLASLGRRRSHGLKS